MRDKTTLDPVDWDDLRANGHRMLDDILNYIQNIRERPVWQPIPGEVRDHFKSPVPVAENDLAVVYDEFLKNILPFSTGNVHPGFMGWVHGGGNPAGMLGEMLAAGLNANLGGRDHTPIEVERQITQWVRDIFGFPEEATGLFVTGTSTANLIGVLVARTATLGTEVRRSGLAASRRQLVAYASAAAHGCVARALEISGIGSDALRLIETDELHRLDTGALERAIISDRHEGLLPFLIVGTAGSVDVGAIDDLAAIAEIAQREKLWFHVDGAFGALGILAPEIQPRLKGIESADSIAFDFHKWGQVPYDAGFILVRDGSLHHDTFASRPGYLTRDTRGLAGGSPWPCDFGLDLSRGFRALKTWFTLKVHGTEKIGAVIAKTCTLARDLESKVVAEPELELLAPAQLNIVCFRYRSEDPDRINSEIVASLHESGIVAPSVTVLSGRVAIRAALVNHRTEACDVDALVQSVLELGRSLARS
ncbi:glutamate/tyrosine decarboxylase-like PLP-dependent enzyme [Microvirga lupini]|uniref:Glutamate/tyrosine decarboxylase-like PLP-dependent enzyme n=1 Tax=Microvirga lupini TaxID=420324 RepID=A0A7W4YVT5_9HYPH|nr:pyridoxal-dependent decarboxylase [Microvirga lupini]MBB3018740.1 glutamate/tyrosine decarboxylase-like PLP-dependent enzyme [Microvirga lupini]